MHCKLDIKGNARDIIAAVLQVWKEYPHKKINHMFLTLITNFEKCNQVSWRQ
jgi:hypothetical protein